MNKKFLFLISLIVIISVVLCSFAACFNKTESQDKNTDTPDTGDNDEDNSDDDDNDVTDPGDENEPPATIYGFGERHPVIAPSVQLSSDMSAMEMLEVGVKNYYGASYIASNSEGALNTQVMGLNFTQFVKSQTIRQGSLSGDYRQFSSNISGSIGPSFIKIMIWEETAIEKNGGSMLINFRNANKDDLIANQTADNDYELVFEESKGFNAIESYSDIDDYQTSNITDPTKIWMYDINENTYDKDNTSEPVKNEDGTYTFKIVADPKASTVEYTKQMMYMLNCIGIKAEDFEFRKIELEITMWDNGFIKSIDITESYSMNISGILKTDLTLNTYRELSYYDDEDGFTPADLTEMMSLSHNVA